MDKIFRCAFTIVSNSCATSSNFILMSGKETKSKMYSDVMEKVSKLCWKTYLRLILCTCPLSAVEFDQRHLAQRFHCARLKFCILAEI